MIFEDVCENLSQADLESLYDQEVEDYEVWTNPCRNAFYGCVYFHSTRRFFTTWNACGINFGSFGGIDWCDNYTLGWSSYSRVLSNFSCEQASFSSGFTYTKSYVRCR